MTATVPSQCPVSHVDYRLERASLENYTLLNAEREASAFHWNDTTADPFWMITRYEHVLEAMQMPDVFTNDIVNALNPFLAVRFLPNNLNPPEHTRMRKVLNRWFSPAAVRRIEDQVLSRCTEMIEQVGPKGGCDFVAEFAIRFPTEMFLASLGLPVEDSPQFVSWVDDLFSGTFGGPAAEAAAVAIKEYFDHAISDRERAPRDPQFDFLTNVLRPEVRGDWLTREDLLTTCMTLMTAGLDTTRSALGYIFAHLATHPADRRRIIDDPASIPAAVEEFVRLYSLILQDGRLVARDIDFHGMPMKKGDVVWLGIASANRDPRKFADPDSYDPDRADLSHHLGFAAGPHRCLGMHLARHELVIALREWHARIPDYSIADGTSLRERGSQLTLLHLPLVWDASAVQMVRP